MSERSGANVTGVGLALGAICLSVLALAAGCAGQQGVAREEARASEGSGGASEEASLLDGLREGGYVIYFRHASTDRLGQPDDDLSSCETQRNLNEEGRAEAREIGEAFEELGIPVGEVVASPYCRAQDTAELAFGRAEVDEGIMEDEELAEILSEPPRDGATNKVVVGHGMPFSAAAGLSMPDEGGAVILAPVGGEGNFEEAGRVGDPDDWPSLGADG